LLSLLAAGCQWLLPMGQPNDVARPPQADLRTGDHGHWSDVGALCGNERLDPGELCDGSQLNGKTCGALGFAPGDGLACSGCRFNTSGCNAASSHLRLVYGNATGLVFVRMEPDGTWGPEVAIPLVGSVRWTRNRILPGLRTELAAALTETPSGMRLYLLHFGSAGWVIDDMLSLPIAALDRDKRVFDLTVESGAAGKGLLVYSDETPNPYYRTHDGTEWLQPKRVFSGAAPGKGVVRHVALAASPKAGEAALAYSDSLTSVYVMSWKAGAFVVPAGPLDPPGPEYSGPTGEPYQAFDVAFEGLSGKLMVIGGNTCCTCPGYWVGSDSGGMYNDEGSGVYQCVADWGLVRLAPRAQGNEIALAIDNRYANVWNGSGWANFEDRSSGDPLGQYGDPWWADVAWIESPPVVVMAHRGWPGDDPEPASGKLFWRTSQGPGWTWSAMSELAVPGLGRVVWPALVSTPGGASVVGLFADDQNSLWAATFNGTSWKVANNGSAVGKGLATTATRAFSMDYR
jgi:hypothetical protein